jgi:hypothetical protein
MNCKSCNTKIPSSDNSCPACGRSAPRVSLGTPQQDKRANEIPPLLPGSALKPATPAKPAKPATPAKLAKPATPAKPVAPAKPVTPAKLQSTPKANKNKKSKAKAKGKGKGASSNRSSSTAGQSAAAKTQREPAESTGWSLFSLDPAELRTLLGEQPDLLEAGLTVMCGEAGQPEGHRYQTEVGEIDLLAVDQAGGLVVVTVADRDPTPGLIADVLQRVGWVRTHLGKDGARVRAIVLTEPLSEDLRYTAAAVSDSVDFKTYRVSLSFDNLRLS